MAHVLAARVGATSTTTGTGEIALGAGLTAHQGFNQVLVANDTTEYLLYASDAGGVATGQWEVGTCTYFEPWGVGPGGFIARTQVEDNSEGTKVPLSLAAGTKHVVISPLASRLSRIPPPGGLNGQTLIYDTAGGGLVWAGDQMPVLMDSPYGGTNIYVRADGSNSNDGATDSPSGAFLTIERAVQEALKYRLLGECYIRVGAGSYIGFSLHTMEGQGTDMAQLQIIGDEANPAAVVFDFCSCTLQNLVVAVTNVRIRQYAEFAKAWLVGCTFDPTGTAAAFSQIKSTGDVTLYNPVFVGTANTRFYCEAGAKMEIDSPEFTDAGTTSGTVSVLDDGARMRFTGTTVGSTTGVRYSTGTFCVIDAAGGGDSSLPGSTAGTLSGGSVLI